MEFDWRPSTALDRVIAGGALVAFIATFLPWYGASVGPFSSPSTAGPPASRPGRARCSSRQRGCSWCSAARHGIFLALIAGIAAVTAAVMAMRPSGEQAPWAPADHQPPQPEPGPDAPPAAPEE